MRIYRIDPLIAKAEGVCCGVPYTTELAGRNGVAVHFWCGAEAPSAALLQQLADRMCRRRDVMRMSWSPGVPDGYWAHDDFS